MRRYHIALLVLCIVVLTPSSGFRLNAEAGPLPSLVNLAPGTDLRIQQDVVNVVLVGFGGLVDPAAMPAQPYALPRWNGVPKANGQGQTFISQRFDFRYHITAAPTWFDDAPPVSAWEGQ